MARKKVKMAFIANASERKNCYKKRKHSLLKKTEEISTLCGIKACAIVYSPYDVQPQIWPSESSVQNVVEKFRSFPEWLQIKNKVNQEMFLSQRIVKAKEQMKKVVKENKQDEISMLIYQCISTKRVEPDIASVADFKDVLLGIEQNLKDINERMGALSVNEMPLMTNQSQIQTLANQSQVQMPTYQSQMQTLEQQFQIQAPTYQPQLQIPAYQPEMPTLVPEEMTMLNCGYAASDVNANPMPNQGWMDLLNGNIGEYETTMIPFGDPNLPL